jgi:hypothetical protein
MLVQRAMDEAEKLGLDVFLESTPAGHPLYLKLGFEDVRMIEFDARKYGIDRSEGVWVSQFVFLPDCAFGIDSTC